MCVCVCPFPPPISNSAIVSTWVRRTLPSLLATTWHRSQISNSRSPVSTSQDLKRKLCANTYPLLLLGVNVLSRKRFFWFTFLKMTQVLTRATTLLLAIRNPEHQKLLQRTRHILMVINFQHLLQCSLQKNTNCRLPQHCCGSQNKQTGQESREIHLSVPSLTMVH